MTARLERAKSEWHQAVEREQRARWELEDAQKEADAPPPAAPHKALKENALVAAAGAAAGAATAALVA
mgnify:FL=1